MAAAHLDRRVDAARAHLRALDADALLVTHLPNITWLSGFTGSAAVLLLTPATLHLLTDTRYDEATAHMQQAGAFPVGTEVAIVEGALDEAAVDILASAGARAIAIEADHLPVRRFTRVQAVAPKGAHLVAAEPFLERLRAVKDAVEIGIYRAATARLAEVCACVPRMLVKGRAERDIAAEIEFELKRHGFQRPAFDTIVASGPNSAMPHARPTDRLLGEGDPVVLDFGGVYAGYCVDLTRTGFIGHPPEAFLELFAAVADAQTAAIEAVKEGARAADIDAIARGRLVARGLEDAIAHATGHGLGMTCMSIHVSDARRRGPRIRCCKRA